MTDPLAAARALFLSGLAHAEAGRLAEAERDFEAGLAHAPGRPSLLVNLGVVRWRAGRPADAVVPLVQAVEAEPGNANAWLHLGQAQAALDQPGAALASLARATEAAPALADAWTQLGHLQREMGRPQDAATSYERALAAGGDKPLNGYYLAAVQSRGDAPDAPPRDYVEALFDQYAADFDQHLVGTLGYRGHERLVEEVVQLGARQYAHALDLGCGTGLCGPLLARIADRVDGVDLSAAMLEKARALGVYGELVHADVADYLARGDWQGDLVVAADVFIYVGRLEAVFAGAARALVPGGAFCFTVEAAPEGQDLLLQPSLRYAHSGGYLRRLAAEQGFEVARLVRGPQREDQQDALPAWYAALVRR